MRKASREVKQAEAEPDHPEDGNARAKEFLRLGGEPCERLTGRLGWRVIVCAVSAGSTDPPWRGCAGTVP